MTNGQATIPASETVAFLFQRRLVTDKNHVDIRFYDGLESAFDTGSWTVVSAHRIKRDFYAG
jgi:hypothetical protein